MVTYHKLWGHFDSSSKRSRLGSFYDLDLLNCGPILKDILPHNKKLFVNFNNFLFFSFPELRKLSHTVGILLKWAGSVHGYVKVSDKYEQWVQSCAASYASLTCGIDVV